MTETIQNWAAAWKWIMIVGAGGFVFVALYAAVAGWRDLRNLFAALGRQKRGERQSTTGDTP